MIDRLRSCAFAVAFAVWLFPIAAYAEDPQPRTHEATEDPTADPEDDPDYRAPKGSLPVDTTPTEDPPPPVPSSRPAEPQSLDWKKKMLLVSAGAGGFALGYGLALASSGNDGSSNGPYNHLLRIPFVGPAIYGANAIPNLFRTKSADSPNVTPVVDVFGAAVGTVLLLADTVLQVGGVFAVGYGAAAPIRKKSTMASRELRPLVHLRPMVGFKTVGLVGTF